MKHLYFIFFLIFSSRLFALDAEVAAVKAAIPTNDRNTIQQAFNNLETAIFDHELNDGSLARSPSPARQKTRDEIKQALLPIKDDLIAIASTNDSFVANGAINILGYSDGGPEVYQILLKNIKETQDAGIANISLSSLNRLGLADKTVQDAAVQRLAEYDPNDHSGNSVAGGIWREAFGDPLPEGLDTFIKFLSPNYPYRTRVGAAKAITTLRSGGIKALPELEQLLAWLKANDADFRDIQTVEYAILEVNSKPATSEEKNIPATNISATPQPSASVPTAASVPTSQTIPSSPIESNTSISIWIYIIILLSLGCIGGIWFLFLREKK
jgi:hypothetical protein